MLPTSASKHNWTGWGESEAATIVHSCPSVVCQRVSVFLGSHEIDFLPVGKQYCEGGNHSRSVLCLTGLWEGKNRGACGAGSEAARYGRQGYDSTHTHCLHGTSNIQLEVNL